MGKAHRARPRMAPPLAGELAVWMIDPAHLSPAITDNVWALCEAGATGFQIGQIRQLRRDRQIAGVHWYMTAFYIAWGLLNVPFYASLGQYRAMAAGMCMTAANIVWLTLAIRYGRKA